MIKQGTGEDAARAAADEAAHGILRPMVGASISVHCSPPSQLKLKKNPIEEWKLFKQLYKNYSMDNRIRNSRFYHF